MRNNKSVFSLLVFILLSFIIFVLILFLDDFSKVSDSVKASIFSLITIFFILTLALVINVLFISKRKKIAIKNNLDYYVDELVSDFGIGIIMYDEKKEIFWSSNFINKHFSKRIVGKKIFSIHDAIEKNWNNMIKNFEFKKDGLIFRGSFSFLKNFLIIQNISHEKIASEIYSKEKMIIGELETDNYQQFQTMLSDEDTFKIQSLIISILDKVSTKYKFTYRQYVNGKFLLLLNNDSFQKLKNENFKFLDEIRNGNIFDEMVVTASIGFGGGSLSYKENSQLAKDALIQAQSRGGDQIVWNQENKPTKFFGSKIENERGLSKIKIKAITKLLEQKLSSEEIQKVIIYGHTFADLDAIGAALGIYELVKKYSKKVFIQNTIFDMTTKKALNELFSKEEMENIFIKDVIAKKKTTKKSTLVIIVDTAEINRLENSHAIKDVDESNIFVFDHHRTKDLQKNIFPQHIYIDTTASSASEIVTEVLNFSNKKIKLQKSTAQMLLNGIFLDTNQFSLSTSSRTFEAASWLEDQKADASLANSFLKMPSKFSNDILSLAKDAIEIKPGFYLAYTSFELPSDIISIVANEILRTKNRKAAFVVAKIPNKKIYKMSARGVDTNVQIIAENIGGGGHFSAAAATTNNESLEVFIDNIKQAIISTKGEN